ncbi:MAG: hypothetical protein EOM87_03320 [Clostridia bacterium]|nr:hypothetical protein [Clostridia bacterium]
MNGFQPISYGEVSAPVDNTEILQQLANVKLDTSLNTELLQKLTNVQTYSSLILNNMGISVNTGLVLPEFAYNGNVSQTGYELSYGTTIMNACRNYNYTFGFDISGITTKHFIEVRYRFNNIIYTSYPIYQSYNYFVAEPSFYNPLRVAIAENGIFTTNYSYLEGSCGIRFTWDKVYRAPVNVLYVGALQYSSLL